jgi:hypothetical protein
VDYADLDKKISTATPHLFVVKVVKGNGGWMLCWVLDPKSEGHRDNHQLCQDLRRLRKKSYYLFWWVGTGENPPALLAKPHFSTQWPHLTNTPPSTVGQKEHRYCLFQLLLLRRKSFILLTTVEIIKV